MNWSTESFSIQIVYEIAYDSAGKRRRKFRGKLCENTVPSTKGIRELLE
jgi:hypothetical protein